MKEHFNLDTEIVRLMNEVKEDKVKNKVYTLANIKTGAVVIQGQIVDFETKQLFDGNCYR